MTTEEAMQILNEAVITEPSIKSYSYISAEDINAAIQQILLELEIKEEKIKKLENTKNNKKVYVKNKNRTSFVFADVNY